MTGVRDRSGELEALTDVAFVLNCIPPSMVSVAEHPRSLEFVTHCPTSPVLNKWFQRNSQTYDTHLESKRCICSLLFFFMWPCSYFVFAQGACNLVYSSVICPRRPRNWEMLGWPQEKLGNARSLSRLVEFVFFLMIWDLVVYCLHSLFMCLYSCTLLLYIWLSALLWAHPLRVQNPEQCQHMKSSLLWGTAPQSVYDCSMLWSVVGHQCACWPMCVCVCVFHVMLHISE